LKGGDILIECLKAQGVRAVFGMPGTQNLEIYDSHQTTGMGRAFSLPDPTNTMGEDQEEATYYHRASDRHYTVARRNGSYYLSRHQLNEKGKTVVVGVNETLQVGHAVLDVVGWWGNEGRIAGTRAADPVPGPPKLAGHHGSSTAARQQTGVHLAHETVRQWEAAAETIEAVIQGRHGVGGFEHIAHGGTGCASTVVEHQVGQRGLGAFDLGGQDRFYPHVAVYEEGGIRQQLRNRVEAAEGGRGRFEGA